MPDGHERLGHSPLPLGATESYVRGMDELATRQEMTGETTFHYQVDPVCLELVEEAETREHDLVTGFEGRGYFFCSGDCLQAFEHEPTRYAVAGRSSP